MLRYLCAGFVTMLAAVGLVLVSGGTAAAAAPLCTRATNVNSGGHNISVPADPSGNVTCVIGRTQAANTTVVRHLQTTLKTCYPTVHLASPYQNELVGNLSTDGFFGARTHAAMKGVQSAIGANPDGVYGPMTRNLMRFTSNDVPSPPCYDF